MGLLESWQNLKFQPSAGSMGLLNAGAQMLANSGPSLRPQGFGQALGQGIGGFTDGFMGFQDREAEQEDALIRRQLLQAQMAAQDPEAQRQKMLNEAKIKAEINKQYPDEPKAPTGFIPVEGGLQAQPIIGMDGISNYGDYQLKLASQKAQMPGYGEPERLNLAQQANDRASQDLLLKQQETARRAKEAEEAKARGRMLPVRAVDKLTESQGAMETSERLKNTFKPEYGGHTILGNASNTAGRLFGDDSGQTQWWQDHQAQKNEVRNDLFGSALTPTEQAEWEKASINSRMNSDEIQKNLKRQQEIETVGYKRKVQNFKKAGYDTSGFEIAQPPEAPVQPTGKPTGVSDEKWNAYQRYLNGNK